MSTRDTVVTHLRRTVRELNSRGSVRDIGVALDLIVSTAPATVPGTDVAGLTFVDDHYVSALDAASSCVVGKLDALQGERGDGPSATVLAEDPGDGTVLVEDFAGEDRDRWPEFGARALEAGYRSMVSVLLEVEGYPRGTLNLYGSQPHAFDAQSRRAAGLLGMTAGMLLLGVEHAAALERAVAGQELVGRATDVLREHPGLDEDAAHVRLVDLASWLDRDPRSRHRGHLTLVPEPRM